MMHYTAEILIPPNADVEKAVAEIMEPFNEQPDDDEDGDSKYAFWDFYIIGGRFSGAKLEARLDPERLEAFIEELKSREFTCSGVQFGKKKLQPESQEAEVDQLWREWFPGNGDVCPLFSHGRDQYRKDGYYSDDVCRVSEIPERLECSRLIVSGPHWGDPNRLEAKQMLVTEFYNGAGAQSTDFDGKVKPVVEKWLSIAGKEYPLLKSELNEEWLCVTVDYHS